MRRVTKPSESKNRKSRLSMDEIADKSCHPIVKFIEEEIVYQDFFVSTVMGLAGLGENTLRQWRRGHNPSIANIDAVLNVLGYGLTVKPLHDIDDE